MAKKLYEEENIKDIANALREVNGTETKYLTSEMGDAVRAVGGSEEFVGIKYSDFTGIYNKPKIADARSLVKMTSIDDINNGGGLSSLFGNATFDSKGGYNSELETVYLPDNLNKINANLFGSACKLIRIYGDCSQVEEVADQAFNCCFALSELPQMFNLTKLGLWAFAYCQALTEFRFYKKVISIHNAAFTSSGITDIYVPWAEGEVANAPWGATNATIHYNTVYDENHEPIV